MKGQSLFEVVLALSVISLIILGIVVLAIHSIKNSNFSRDKTLATNFSSEAFEWLRGQRDANWTGFYGRASAVGATYSLESKPISGWGSSTATCSSANPINSTFKRIVTLKSINVNAVEATVRVCWNDSAGYHEINSTTDLTNFKAK